jgi:DNA-binding HxlR family transcriptional regulator
MDHDYHAHGPEIFCPANAALNLLGGRWTLHIVRTLLGQTRRFNEIAREIGLNPATLRERLRALEEEAVVTRTVRSTMPPHVEYALTEKGQALNGIFERIAEWAREWMTPKGEEWVDPPQDDAADLLAAEPD